MNDTCANCGKPYCNVQSASCCAYPKLPTPKGDLRVLDLFAGTGSSTQAFVDRGHHVKTLEWEPRFRPTFEMDIKQFAKNPKWFLGSWRPDIIWGSPDCTAFSMAGSGSKEFGSERWAYDGPYPFFGPRLPTDKKAREGCAFVLAMYQIINVLRPKYWFRENPQGGMQTMAFSLSPLVNRLTGYENVETVTVTYCQYGDTRMKPTNILGVFPPTWEPKPRCYNGDPCHEAAPRGARTGTQGLSGSEERSKVPYALGLEICEAVERAYAGGTLGRMRTEIQAAKRKEKAPKFNQWVPTE